MSNIKQTALDLKVSRNMPLSDFHIIYPLLSEEGAYVYFKV